MQLWETGAELGGVGAAAGSICLSGRFALSPKSRGPPWAGGLVPHSPARRRAAGAPGGRESGVGLSLGAGSVGPFLCSPLGPRQPTTGSRGGKMEAPLRPFSQGVGREPLCT